MSTFGNQVTTYKSVKIDGTAIACPSANGVSITRNLIQTANTRRTASAKMVGKNVAVKVTYKFSFPPSLTPTQIDTIRRLVTSLTFKHTMTVVNEASKEESFECYFGNYSAEQYGFIGGKMLNQSLSFEAVEI